MTEIPYQSLANRGLIESSIKNEGMIEKVEEATADITYIGRAEPGVATSDDKWQIKRIDTSVLAADILYADGNVLYDNVWDNRGSLSYS